MNILFLMKFRLLGGIEIVTRTLANRFVKKGHQVCIYSFEKKADFADEVILLDDNIEEIYHECGGNHVQELHDILVHNKIDIIINQWGLPYYFTKTICKAKKKLRTPLISIYHNCPDTNARITGANIALANSKTLLEKVYWLLYQRLITKITSLSMNYVYNHSNIYLLLSQSFKDKFVKFANIKDTSKVRILTNPLTIPLPDSGVYEKQKEIIYVGRIDYNQKRVYRIIDVWAMLENNFSDWRLTIVGDGPEKANLQKKARILGLKRVSFEGFQNPEKYYRRASILCLTSEYEGFPLVLPECMSFGIVPIVYGSYSAVYDIIDSGTDGYILQPDDKSGFNTVMMKEYMEKLMISNGLLKSMSEKAIEKSKQFSIDSIYSQWLQLFHELDNKIKV